MTRAVWEGKVIAEHAETQDVDGYTYFPPEAVNMELLRGSDHTSYCGWKGKASYYHVVVGERTNQNAAWSYVDPKPEAAALKGHIAFWKGVSIEG